MNRLPKQINLGCGNVVKIEEVPRAVIQSAIGQDTEAAWSCEPPAGSQYIGVIFIDKTLPYRTRRALLYHELVHAAVDIMQWEIDAR